MIDKKRLIKNFVEMAKIDSISGEEYKFASFLETKLKHLGAKVMFDSYGNLIARFNGLGNPLMLNAHLDTVEPGKNIKPKVSKNKIISDGQTILGADAKVGIAIILEVLKAAKDNNLKIRPLDIVLTREEETTLNGAKNLDYSLLAAKEGIVIDGDEEVFKIFISSPTYYNLDVEIVGKSAHAGVEPEKGISSIEIASKIISLLKMGRIDSETTFNIGTINGGTVRNAVAEKTVFNGEIRGRNKNTLNEVILNTRKTLNKVAKLYPKAKVNYKLTKDFEGFLIDGNHSLVLEASKVLKKMNLTAQLKDSGGGSDANIFIKNGIDVIIVGTGTYESHTTREFIVINQMAQAARFCLEFIRYKN